MENENLQQPVRENNTRSIRDILFILRKNLTLMLIVFMIVIVAGAVFTFVVNAGYTSKEMVMLNIKNEQSTSDNTKPNVNTMSAWRHTIMDFCSQGVVLDRASYYYEEYKKDVKEGSVDNVDDYITNNAIQDKSGYDPENLTKKYFSASKISINGFAEDSDDPEGFSFSVNYEGDSASVAYDKVRILAYAFGEEAGYEDGANGNVYFGGMHVTITSFENLGTTSNKNVMTNMVVAVLLGLVLALVSVYLKIVLDNTVKSKEDLEKITGVSVLSAIENKE